MDLIITPLSKKNRQMCPKEILGETTCPSCGQDNIWVINDRGPEGDERMNYLENHRKRGTNELCMGSEKLLCDFS